MENPLNVWLFSTGKMVTDSKLQNVTHFMFDGGKLDISNDHETFQMLYSKYIKYKNCIVERKTDFFKFFIDFDILSEEIINLDQYINIIQSTLGSLYKTNELLCIVTGANKNKEITKENKKYIKQGFHLHWPGIVVNKETAKCIRKNLIVNLTNVFGKDIKHYDTWEKIIDLCVYENNGLRLVGSDKCSMSDGARIYEERIYILKDVYIGTNKDESRKDFYESDTFQLIKDTSIRCDANSITDVHDLGEYIESEEPIKLSGNLITIQKSSSEYKSIEKFFKLHATGYKVEDIRTITQVKDKPMYLISSKSKFCQNKQDFHSNNHIYFKLTPSGLCQKCRSESTGVHGSCREYQSMCVPITPALASSLNWKKSKPKNVEIKKQENFSIPSLLERLENNITGKEIFKGPGKKK
tara:strand:+ start:1624 stop:2856 length:1233 start_codon:yes stop_codon:yes gene_type:complete